MEIKITKDVAEFNTSEYGGIKKCIFVEFPNCVSSTTGKSFKWMPSYKQLEDIKAALEEIENESWEKENDNFQ